MYLRKARPSIIVERVEAESVTLVRPIESLYPNEAGVMRLCEFVTAVLEKHRQLSCNHNRLVMCGMCHVPFRPN